LYPSEEYFRKNRKGNDNDPSLSPNASDPTLFKKAPEEEFKTHFTTKNCN